MKTRWIRLSVLAMSVLCVFSCSVLKRNETPEENSPKFLVAGEAAPFDGWLLPSDTFAILLKEAGRE